MSTHPSPLVRGDRIPLGTIRFSFLKLTHTCTIKKHGAEADSWHRPHPFLVLAFTNRTSAGSPAGLTTPKLSCPLWDHCLCLIGLDSFSLSGNLNPTKCPSFSMISTPSGKVISLTSSLFRYIRIVLPFRSTRSIGLFPTGCPASCGGWSLRPRPHHGVSIRRTHVPDS